ncbi:tubulin epsilon and delta complex protein 2 [Loxodonta africana]|uniref:tubulin epsilon and delta complex protein 2 n=1 Tax=Loxodonta africana TaxID=9785 RepID=UPI0030CB3A64
MLPADCSLRLVAELRAALDACGEQQRQLDQSLRVCRRLLRAWEPTRPAAPEPTPGPEPNEEDPSPACAPSLQDLTELELLTQALEKAVRVRKGISKVGEGDKAPSLKPRTVATPPATTTSVPPQAPGQAGNGTSETRSPRGIRQPKVPARSLPEHRLLSTRERTSLGRGARATRPSLGDQQVTPSVTPLVPEAFTLKEKGTLLRLPMAFWKAASQNAQRHCTSFVKALRRVNQAAPSHVCTMPGKLSIVVTSLPPPPVSEGRTAPPLHPVISVSISQRRSPLSLFPGQCPLIPQGLWGSFLAFRRARHPSCGPAWPCPAGWNNWHPSPDSWVLVCPSLWAQIDSTQASDSANATARTRFLLKMQAASGWPGVGLSAAVVEAEVGRLRKACLRLRLRMGTELAAAPTDCVQEYRCLLLLEGLQATVGQCLHWLQELRKVVAKHHLELCPSGMPARASCLCEGGADAAWSPQPLLYSSTQELQTLAALRLRVAMLDQQLHLEKVLMDELLPLVRTQRPCCVAVCRAVHSLLCNGGQHFPTVLQDEPAD